MLLPSVLNIRFQLSKHILIKKTCKSDEMCLEYIYFPILPLFTMSLLREKNMSTNKYEKELVAK